MDFLIYRSKNFVVQAVEKPLVDRFDGGHIVIDPIVRVADRQQLSPRQAIECMRLTIVTGEAMTKVLRRHGVNVGRINYQDNGNWGVFTPEGPYFHVHLYGRAIDAKIQKYGQACFFPHRNEQPEFYANLKPLSKEDVDALRVEVEDLLSLEKFSDKKWGLD